MHAQADITTADNRRSPPPPPRTKVTIVGRNEICFWENLIGPFFRTQTFGSQTPPPPRACACPVPSLAPCVRGGGGRWNRRLLWNGKIWCSKSVPNYAAVFAGPQPFRLMAFSALLGRAHPQFARAVCSLGPLWQAAVMCCGCPVCALCRPLCTSICGDSNPWTPCMPLWVPCVCPACALCVSCACAAPPLEVPCAELCLVFSLRGGGWGGWGVWHKASALDCLPLVAPIGLSPLLILTFCVRTCFGCVNGAPG